MEPEQTLANLQKAGLDRVEGGLMSITDLMFQQAKFVDDCLVAAFGQELFDILKNTPCGEHREMVLMERTGLTTGEYSDYVNRLRETFRIQLQQYGVQS